MALQNTAGFVPVSLALAGNILVTILKFGAAVASGSSSMFSEAVHSVADTANQILLLVGLRQSLRQADDSFEYGYGNERYFWALISACGVFFVGAGVTAYKGISALLHPEPIDVGILSFGVLFFALLIESYTLWIALRSLARSFPHHTWVERLNVADTSTLAVVLEDGIAVLGVIIAAGSIALSQIEGTNVWDGLGSLAISVLLAAVAIVLITKNRAYLLGRAIPEEIQEEIEKLLLKEPAIERLIDFKSSTHGLGVWRIKCEVEFNGNAVVREAQRGLALKKQFQEMGGDFESFKKFLVEYTDRIPRLLGKKIDEIEAKVKKRFPSIRHIDIEIN